MSDLVERLRQPVMLHRSAEHTNAERREAAAEIERLQEALALTERAKFCWSSRQRLLERQYDDQKEG